MAITGLDRRASKLEDSLGYIKQQREREEEAVWRKENSERLRWEMFLRHFGSRDSFNWARRSLEDPENDAETHAEAEAALSLEESLQRVLSHTDSDGNLDYQSMNSSDKAVANLLNTLFLVVDDTYLFKMDLERWRDILGLDLPPFIELIKAIDTHLGSSNWRQICCLEESQKQLLKTMFEVYEFTRDRALQYREQKAQGERLPQAIGV